MASPYGRTVGQLIMDSVSPLGQFVRQNPLESAAIATAPVPIVGDVAGLLSDANMYYSKPEERNLANYGMSLLGALPFVPAPSVSRKVSGLVVREHVPNMESIPASFYNYKVEEGVRELPMSDIPYTAAEDIFSSADDIKRSKELAEQIKSSGEINPLIIVEDSKGKYILEGAHRMAALNEIGVDTFPAVVVKDLD